ncbi:hypothetical protein [Candidatus Electronema sp. PJ]|uniref:hypothetical protein n=1 Tax=Candidatus Electronema sp. PJ TaxID=3401572 RepID=UPI003AA8526F
MATFPYFPKNDSAPSAPDKITLKHQSRTVTMDEINERVVAKFPERDPDEIRHILKLISERRLELLVSGTDIVMDDGSYWTLDADRRTILICMPEDKK